MRPDIVPGGLFPDYELRDHSGANRRLSDLQGADPMVLVLSRGSFCPKDREQHRLLAAMEPEFKVAYTKIVTISTDTLMEANEMRDGVGAHWTFLIDSARAVQRDLDIVEYTDAQLDLRAVTEKVRPDWDISAPAQREAWERGDKTAFWPYGKTLRQVFADVTD
jgi:peroxiredoxin